MNVRLIQSKEDLHLPIRIKAFVESVEKSEDGSFRLSAAIASDGSKDRYDESINPDGWELRNFKKNPVLLWGHDYHAKPVGKVTKISVRDGNLLFDAEFAPTTEASEIAKLYELGFLKAFSVGFLPKTFGPDFWLYAVLSDEQKAPESKFTYETSELLEISCVTVPANPKALVEAKSLVTSEALKKDLEAEAPAEAPVEPAPATEPAPAATDAPTEAAPATTEGETATEATTATPAEATPAEEAEEASETPEETKGAEVVAEHEWTWSQLEDGTAEFLKDPELKAAMKKIHEDFQTAETAIEELRQKLQEQTGKPVTAKDAVKVLNVRMSELSSTELKGIDKSIGLRLRVLKTPNSQKEGGDN